jgi:hypothetical protein
MPLGAAELSPQLRASWLGGRALGDGGAAQLNPAPQYATDGQSSMCFGHHQKYESDATLFACYDAVTPLRERFCQNAFARRGDGSRSATCHLGVQLGGSARPLHCPTPGQPRSRAMGRRQLYGCTGAAAFLPFLPHCGLRTALCHAQRTLC